MSRFTHKWKRKCPRCDRTLSNDDFPCPNCGKGQLRGIANLSAFPSARLGCNRCGKPGYKLTCPSCGADAFYNGQSGSAFKTGLGCLVKAVLPLVAIAAVGGGAWVVFRWPNVPHCLRELLTEMSNRLHR